MTVNVVSRYWGTLPDGRDVRLFTITDGRNRQVSLSDYGGVVTSIIVPDRNGIPGDVALGYDTLEEYLHDNAYLGAMVGRFANRIAGAAFTLNGQRYILTANEGKNTLHGGAGFSTKLWEVEAINSGILLHYVSPDGEDGFPGRLEVTVRATFKDDLIFEFTGVSSKDTVMSMTNHTYFNLTCGGNVLSHVLAIEAGEYLTVDNGKIPIIRTPVKGGPFDFRIPRPIGAGYYDHGFVLDKGDPAATLYDPISGRTLEMRTEMPCLQLYVGGAMSERRGKGGTVYRKNSGLALEPQHFPNSPNRPDFPSPVLRAGELYNHFISLRFGARQVY
jgi:aldose 1-epimerase